MNFKRCSNVFFILSGLFILTSNKVGSEWYFGIVDTDVEDFCFSEGETSLALGSNNNPHISYYDRIEDKLKYAYYDGTWHVSIVDSAIIDCSGLGCECPGQTSLALDSNDNPHIIYYERFYDNGWHQNLKYAYYDDTWHIETVDDISTFSSSFLFCSIALDSNDTPHISYEKLDEIKYAYYDGSWHKETVDVAGIWGPVVSSLILDRADNPHIVYGVYYEYYGDGELKYAHYDGNWHIELICPIYGGYSGGITHISLALDSNEEPHICYNEDFGGTSPDGFWFYSGQEYVYFDGTWHSEHCHGTNYNGYYSEASIALDNRDNIHIIYNTALGPILKYDYYDTTWYTETVCNNAKSISFAIDSNNVFHISYIDTANRDLMYAYNTDNVDYDGDGILNDNDNCPNDANPDQEDSDGDEIGDVCDNCPNNANANQEDTDSDYLGDVCDECTDTDKDGYGNPGFLLNTCPEDNCPTTANPNQEDNYPPQGNGIGDACDCEANFDCDQDVDANDVTAFLTDFGRSQYNRPCTNQDQCKGDFSCDGDVDATDVTKFLEDFGRSQYNNSCPVCVIGNWCVY